MAGTLCTGCVMAEDWAAAAADIAEAIGEFEQAVLRRSQMIGSGPSAFSGPPLDFQISVVRKTVLQEQEGLVGVSKDHLLVSPRAQTAPTTGDRVSLDGGQTFREIESVRTVAPAGVTLLWDVALRG